MSSDDDRLDRSLAALGDGEFDDTGLDQRMAAFKESLRRLRSDPAEAARVDALAPDSEQNPGPEQSLRSPARSHTVPGVPVGRARELTLLNGLLKDLTRGGGNAVLIEGEPGIGKTTLVRTALAALPEGNCQVFWGAGDELGQELPLLPFLDALGVRRPSASARRTTIAGLLRGEFVTDRGTDVPAMLAEQLIALTIDETAARPVVLVIDDLQWADLASIKLWGRLARIARQVPLLLVGLTRPVPQRENLLALRRAVDVEVRVQLTALPQPAVAEMVKELAGGQPDTGLLRLAEGAAGNPLYLTELIAALSRSGGIAVSASGTAQLAAETVPGSLTAAIADRLDFISTATKGVLRAAALLGMEFAIPDLTTVLGKTISAVVPAIDEARGTGVLIDSGNGTALAFRHPLIREALYAELPAAVRSAWHLDAGHALAAAGAAPDRVARQLLRALGNPAGRSRGTDLQPGEPDGSLASARVTPPAHSASARSGDLGVQLDRPPLDTAAVPSGTSMGEWISDWLVTSADSLVGQAPGVAAELLAQAVAGVPAGSARHGWLTSRLADALYRTGDLAAAEQVAEQELAKAADPELVVDLHWTLVQCRILGGRPAESFAALDQALAVPGITPAHRARLLVLAARTDLYYGNRQEASREAERALTAATEAGDTWAASWALHVLADLAAVRGEMASALPLYDRGLAVAETDPALTDLRILLQIGKAATLAHLDRHEEARATAERARNLADQVGTAMCLSQAHSVLGQILFDIGSWDDSLAALAAIPEALKDPVAACDELGIAALIGFHRNDPDAARRLLAASEPYAKRVGQRSIPPLLLARSLDREQAGAPSEALAVLVAAFAHNPDDFGETENLLGDAVRLALKTEDSVTARTLTGQATALAEGSQIPHHQANALYCLGMVNQDAFALLTAAQGYADSGRPLPRAKALEAAAGCLVEAEDRIAARQAFEQAVEVYESLGAKADLNRVRSEFRAYGIRRGPLSRHRRAASGWDSLTETELKIAAVVAEGLSNPDIAARLMLSRRTVATHVSHILKKLNVATRTDIARETVERMRS